MPGNAPEDITMDSEQQEVISSSKSIHIAIGFLIVVLLTLVQVMFQNKAKSPFETHGLVIKLFIVATFFYTLVVVAVTLKPPCCCDYLPLLNQICLIFGALACDSLLFILNASLAYFVFVLCLLLLLRLVVSFGKQILKLICNSGKRGLHLLRQSFRLHKNAPMITVQEMENGGLGN